MVISHNDKATCIFNWNKTTINGGTFTRPNIANTSVCNGFWDSTSAVGELTIHRWYISTVL